MTKPDDRQRPGTTLTHSPQMELRDVFMIHATLADVLMAEDALIESYSAADIIDTDPLTIRIKARYAVADAMLRVRGET